MLQQKCSHVSRSTQERQKKKNPLIQLIKYYCLLNNFHFIYIKKIRDVCLCNFVIYKKKKKSKNVFFYFFKVQINKHKLLEVELENFN